MIDIILAIPSTHNSEQLIGSWQDIVNWALPHIITERKYTLAITFVVSNKQLKNTILDCIAIWSQSSHKSVKCQSLITTPCDEPNVQWFKLYDMEYMSDASARQLSNMVKRHDVFCGSIKFNMREKAKCWRQLTACIYNAIYVLNPGGSIIIALNGECCYADSIYNHIPQNVHSALNLVSKVGELTVWDVDETTIFAVRKCKKTEFSAKACKIMLAHLAQYKLSVPPCLEWLPY